jgi:exopolysaccharide production protein ExoZ
MSTQANRDKLVALQAARGIAAVLVMLTHGSNSLALPQYVGYRPFGKLFQFGHAGVDFFFVLSGFIITYVHYCDLGDPQRFLRYANRRVIRIYPPYWVVTLLLIASIIASGHFERLGIEHLVASMALIPHGQEPLLGVAWTLEHEMLFYACFGLAVLWLPLAWVLLTTCLIFVAAGLLFKPDAWWWSFITAFRHLQFLMGIGAARLVMSGRVPAPGLLAGFGVLTFLLTGLCENAGVIQLWGLAGQLLFGFSSAAIVIGLASAERAELIRVGSIGGLIGGASYAMYLLHELVINDASYVLARLHVMKLLPGWLLLITLSSITIAAAIIFHLTIEQPMMRVLRRWKTHRSLLRKVVVG